MGEYGMSYQVRQFIYDCFESPKVTFISSHVQTPSWDHKLICKILVYL